ncbi:MAG: DUF5752 family protein [Nitrospirota bacterium]
MSPFHFRTQLDQTILLGVKARNVAELLEGIRAVPNASIYHHTHRFLQQHHYLSPEPPNDFAHWVGEVLNDAVLGEKLSSIDIVQFHTIVSLRNRLEELIAAHLQTVDGMADCPPGEEFHFMASQTFVFSTPHIAHNLSEFGDILKRISINSLYYHIFAARLRLEQDENDFSLWFKDLGKLELADAVRRLDPYTYTLEGLRKKISGLVSKHAAP